MDDLLCGICGQEDQQVFNLCAVDHAPARRTIKFGVDSGAAITCVNDQVGQDYPIRAAPLGRRLIDAAGKAVPQTGDRNLGVRLGGKDVFRVPSPLLQRGI